MVRDREELLGLLKSIGIELPRKSKLPESELERRLSKVLDSCQYLSRVVPSPPLNPTHYPTWNKANRVADAVHRINFGEATFNVQDSKMRGVQDQFPLYKTAFMDLRQSMKGMCNIYDQGIDSFIFQDEKQESGICMRILEVREFDACTPILVVVFSHDLRSAAPMLKSIDWLSSFVRQMKTLVTVKATLQEQQLLLQLLKQNSKRLAPSYNPKRAGTEREFTLTFLLPVGPLGVKETEAYSRNDGCSVCGEPAKSKCSRCGAIRYCGAACQKEDWRSHRPTCTSLMGGTWQPLTFTLANHWQLRPGLHALQINRFTNNLDIGHLNEVNNNVHNDTPQSPANTHGNMPFIVKVQLNSQLPYGSSPQAIAAARELFQGRTLPIDETKMLIYDCRRTFEVHVNKKPGGRDTEFDAAAEVVRTKGMRGLKVFCWAVRTGEWTMNLCLDHLPEWQNW